jgi:hypothetical protein
MNGTNKLAFDTWRIAVKHMPRVTWTLREILRKSPGPQNHNPRWFRIGSTAGQFPFVKSEAPEFQKIVPFVNPR